MHGHVYLGVFVAALTALTVLIISASYSQIIELFSSGGGGYLVASKLLNPSLGMVSGCALLIDYVLTIAISIVSGMAAFFSFLPAGWHPYLLPCSLVGVLLLTLMNMRGVKETVIPLTPVFMVFVLTHIIVIVYALITHLGQVPQVVSFGVGEVRSLSLEIGWFGVFFLILRAYSSGAGMFTGIEAVSNGLPILRDPKVATGKKTMQYMSISLAVTVAGLMIAYLLFNVQHVDGKTLNAVLLENITSSWGPWGACISVSDACFRSHASFCGGAGRISRRSKSIIEYGARSLGSDKIFKPERQACDPERYSVDGCCRACDGVFYQRFDPFAGCFIQH